MKPRGMRGDPFAKRDFGFFFAGASVIAETAAFFEKCRISHASVPGYLELRRVVYIALPEISHLSATL